jgi:hypothetical protein
MKRAANEPVRIGGACAFLGDSPYATPQLLKVPGLHYLVYDYLAEVTISVLARSRRKSPEQGGWASEFVDVVLRENLAEIAAKGVKVIANAGGLNPEACGAAVRKLVAELGLPLKVAVVGGDDILPRMDALRAPEMFTGAAMPAQFMSANAYLGAAPIARALALGADIVVTGRVVDSAVTLGALMHEFGWETGDFLRMAQGTAAGQLIECGAQATGGTFTDWFEGGDWSDIGYPVAECFADGRIVLTKPPGTGGIVNVGTVSEQLLYEVDDPGNYIVPDAIVDFTQVQLTQLGPDRVEVTGVQGRAPTGTYKGTATFQDGYRTVVVLPVVGMDAAAKARRQAEALVARAERHMAAQGQAPFTVRHIELLGLEASYGANAQALPGREVIARIVLDHPQRAPLERVSLDAMSPTTSMAPGSTGWTGGRPVVAPMMRVFSFLVPKREVEAWIDLGAGRERIGGWQGGGAPRADAAAPRTAVPEPLASMRSVRLVDLAYARSGDKGNRFMTAVIARDAAYLPWIRRALQPARVAAFMRHVFDAPDAARIDVFEAPGIHALNLVLHDALRGGQMASPRLDPLAKAMAQQLLELPVEIPSELSVTPHAQRVAAARP